MLLHVISCSLLMVFYPLFSLHINVTRTKNLQETKPLMLDLKKFGNITLSPIGLFRSIIRAQIISTDVS